MRLAGYTAVIEQRGARWVGWIEGVPGVSSQGDTREELLANLRSALAEALDTGYAQMAADAPSEAEAREWSDVLLHDVSDESR